MKTAQISPVEYLSVDAAAQKLPTLSTSKFVGSVDIDIVLNVTEKQKKESLRGNITLPHQFAKKIKIAVFCDEKEAKQALDAGAEAAGLDELTSKIEKEGVNFDVVLATPSAMPKIAKLGKLLGPKGLMPNPANSTVISDVKSGVETFLAGKQNFKMSDQGVIRARVAKLDQSTSQIAENISSFIKAVGNEAKKFGPQPIKKITLSPTMGKAVRIDLATLT